MQFDPTNPVIKLCAEGMSFEGKGQNDEAFKLFWQAWNQATNDLEKFTSAHYVARHQKNVRDKLRWDELALAFALKTGDDIKGTLSSLYLNIGKDYEDLNDMVNSRRNYELAHTFLSFLSNDGYGKMINDGVNNGLRRTNDDL